MAATPPRRTAHCTRQQQQQRQLCLFLVAALAMPSMLHAKIYNLTETAVTYNSGLAYAYHVERLPLLGLMDFLALWSPYRVTLNCSTAAYSVLTAHSLGDLLSEDKATKVLWCGWQNIMSDPNVCELHLSALRDNFVAVKATKPGVFPLGQSAPECTLDAKTEFPSDMGRGFVMTMAAVALFVNAKHLARSQAFRLTSGGLLSISGVAVLVLIVIMRNTPAKRAIGAGFAISASGMLAIVRWAFGTWAPGLQQVMFSRLGAWYILITGAAGVAVTYWMDDPANAKINTTIRVFLQGVALVAVYVSFADECMAIAAVLALASYGWLFAISRFLFMAVTTVFGFLRAVNTKLRSWWRPSGAGGAGGGDGGDEGGGGGGGGGPLRRAGSGDTQSLPEDWDEGSYHSSQDADYVPNDDEDGEEVEQRAGIATEDGSDEAEDASDDDGDAGPPPAGGGARSWLGRLAGVWRRPAAAAAAAEEELYPAPSFDQWAQPAQQPGQSRTAQAAPPARAPAAAAAAAAGGGVGGAGSGPASAGGWGRPVVAVDRLQGTTAQQQQQQQQPSLQSPTLQRPSSTSPWSERKVVVDFSKPRSPPAAAAVGSAGAGSSQQRSQLAAAAAPPPPAGPSKSPLVMGGKILNPETGHKIAIGAATYQRLIERGYEPDEVAGTMVLSAAHSSPPPAAAAAGGATAGSSRGGATPAASLRSRSKAQ